MKAGRELDALIAEKVMGRTSHIWSEHFALQKTVYCTICGTTKGKGKEDPYPFCQKDDIPHYSTQIADAWLVVEKLRKDGFYICLMNDGHDGQVWLSMHSENEGTWDKGGQSDRLVAEIDYVESAPLAICLAALKAIE